MFEGFFIWLDGVGGGAAVAAEQLAAPTTTENCHQPPAQVLNQI